MPLTPRRNWESCSLSCVYLTFLKPAWDFLGVCVTVDNVAICQPLSSVWEPAKPLHWAPRCQLLSWLCHRLVR